MIDKDPSACGVVVGEGADGFHLRGECVQSVTEKKNRLVHAPSKPGMSGLPLFQASGNLVCLLHGISKHRGCHRADALDCPSPFLYADSISHELKMLCVNEKYAQALVKAEDFVEDFVEEAHLNFDDSTVTSDNRTFAEEFRKILSDAGMSDAGKNVNKMMDQLANNCFTTTTVNIFDSIMVATNVKGETVESHIEGHQLSQQHHSAISKPETPSPVKRQHCQQAGEEPTETDQL